MKRSKQMSLLPSYTSFYGGDLMKRRKGRRGPRPLAIRKSMHVVLKSSKATGERSFRNPKYYKMVQSTLTKFARQNHIQLISFANVGNHLHLHIQLNHRDGYKRFIRAVTGVIAMRVMNWNRWTKKRVNDGRKDEEGREGDAPGARGEHRPGARRGHRPGTRGEHGQGLNVNDGSFKGEKSVTRFWDYRPYSNVVTSWTGFLRLKDYVKINQLEGAGLPRGAAEAVVKGLAGKFGKRRKTDGTSPRVGGRGSG